PVIGIAALRLSNRMQPDVDADALTRDAIETTLAGIRAGAPTHARRVPIAVARTVAIVALAVGLTSACDTAKGESAAKTAAPKAIRVSVAADTEPPLHT